MQIFNFAICYRRNSVVYSRIKKCNKNIIKYLLVIFIQIISVIVVGYCSPFDKLGARDNIFKHFGAPVIPFALLMLTLSEVKYLLVRKLAYKSWFLRISQW